MQPATEMCETCCRNLREELKSCGVLHWNALEGIGMGAKGSGVQKAVDCRGLWSTESY